MFVKHGHAYVLSFPIQYQANKVECLKIGWILPPLELPHANWLSIPTYCIGGLMAKTYKGRDFVFKATCSWYDKEVIEE